MKKPLLWRLVQKPIESEDMSPDRGAAPGEREVSALMRQLGEMEERLGTLTEGHEEPVVDADGGPQSVLRRAQEELRTGRAALHLVLERLPVAVWTTDADLRLTSLSGAGVTTAEGEGVEVLGRHLSEMDGLGDRPALIAAHHQALEGETARLELEVRGRAYDCSVAPVRGRAGETVGCVGLAIDVTPRTVSAGTPEEAGGSHKVEVEKRTVELVETHEGVRGTEEEVRRQNEELRAAREALEAEHRRYEELFEFAPDGYVVTDAKGIIKEANRAAAELLRAEAEALRGEPLANYVASDDREAFHDLMAQVETEARTKGTEAEMCLRARGAEPFPAVVGVAAMEDAGGRVAGMRWMVRDISESRRLMKENWRQRKFLERLMDAAPVGIAVVRGEEHHFEMANAGYRGIPGARGPVVGRRFEDVFPFVPASAGVEVLDEVYRTGEPISLREREGVFVPGEGQTYWSVDVVPLQETAGGVGGLLMITRDVSQEVRARKEMERLAVRIQRQADQLKGVFEAMADAVIVFDAEGMPLRANQAALEAFGLDPVGMDRKSLAEQLNVREPEGERVAVESLPVSRALRGERVEGARYIVEDAQGATRAVVVSAAPLGRDGGGGGAVAVWHDATERERLLAEIDRQRRRVEGLAEDLRQERDTLQIIMDNTHAHLAYLDADFNFVRVNTAYAQGAGYRKEELIGKGHFDLFPDEENEEIFERVKEAGRPVFFHAKPFVYADRPELGVTYWDWSLVPVRDDDGAVRGLVFSLLDVTERARLMEQLARERAKLQAIVENAPEGIVVVDEKARIVLANPAADELYARPVPYGEAYDTHTRFGLYGSDGTPIPPRELPLTRSALDGETLCDVELAMVVPGGERRHLLADTAPIRDRAGEISGAIGIFRDITARVRAEARVQQYADQLRVLHEIDLAILAAGSAEEIAEASLRGLAELVPSAVSRIALVDLDKGDARVLASSGGEEAESCPAEWCSVSWPRAVGVLAQGKPFVVEDPEDVPEAGLREILRAEGVRSMTCVPLAVGGTLLGCLRVGRREAGGLSETELDILQAVADQAAIGIYQAELHEALTCHAEELEDQVAVRTAQLRASEARFRAIFEQSALGIALLDKNGRVVAANPALQGMLGQRRDEVVGQLFLRFAHPDDEISRDVRVFREIAAGTRDRHRVETRYVGGGGEVRWANMVLSPVRGASGEPQFVIAMVEDFTERKQAQAALVQSERLATTGRLAAALAHEINNPLQAVIGCLGLAEESLAEGDDADLDEYLDIGLRELRRAARIVSRLRDLSRPVDRGQARPTDVNELVDGVLKLTKKRLDSAQICVVQKTAESLPRPEVDPDRIQQVLLNLVLNGIEAMSEGGTLEVGTRYEDEQEEVCVTVRDSGTGIPDDLLPHIFDPFFSTKDEGMGLGLFVSQSIVQEYGGSVEVESEMGKGTAFTVRLPV
ncbi:MAG: PAS domain S-box protein [Chloroflexota bacterium]